MTAVVNVVIPVFAIILVGYLCGRLKLLGPASSDALNGYVYWVALPALFFVGIAKAPIARVLDWELIGAYLLALFAVFLLAYAVAGLAFRTRMAAHALHGLSAAFPNSGYLGIPLFVLLFGENGALPVIALTVAQSVTVFFVTLFLVELDGGQGPLGGRIAKIARNLLLNPFLIAMAAGLAANLGGIDVPVPIDTTLRTLAASASPCALFALGLFLCGRPLTEGFGELAWLSLAKLILLPAVVWLVAEHLFGLPADSIRLLVLTAALPTGALVFVVAQRYDVYVERASAGVLVTTVLSVATISALMVYYGL
jgi:hypothetical protein